MARNASPPDGGSSNSRRQMLRAASGPRTSHVSHSTRPAAAPSPPRGGPCAAHAVTVSSSSAASRSRPAASPAQPASACCHEGHRVHTHTQQGWSGREQGSRGQCHRCHRQRMCVQRCGGLRFLLCGVCEQAGMHKTNDSKTEPALHIAYGGTALCRYVTHHLPQRPRLCRWHGTQRLLCQLQKRGCACRTAVVAAVAAVAANTRCCCCCLQLKPLTPGPHISRV